MAACAIREALRCCSGPTEEKSKKDGSDHFQQVMPSYWRIWRNEGCLSKQCCSRLCALVLRWLWMLSPDPAMQAGWPNLASLSPATDPYILWTGCLNPFPVKPLSVKQGSFMYLHQQHPHCWETTAARHPSPPRGSFQLLAHLESAGRNLPCLVWGSWRQYCTLCVATHYIIWDCDSQNPSHREEQEYILLPWWAKAALWVQKLAGGSIRSRPCILASSPVQLGPYKLLPLSKD